MDFEQALRSNGHTIHLKETPDFSIMGQTDTPNTSPMSQRHPSPALSPSPFRIPHQPSTPNVIPATPSPAPGPSAAFSSRPPTSFPASPNYLAYDPEDAEHQIKRRSMYRSPGTSSSPDLATLMRKAREKGGKGMLGSKKDRRESPPPMPRNYDEGTRKRGSISSQNSPYKGEGSGSLSVSNEWSLSSSLSKQNTRDSTMKAPKSSVRAKTSAFIGKVLGSSTGRERSRTDARAPQSSGHTPAFYDAFTPPVPPLPTQHLPETPLRSVDNGKPLPSAPTPTMTVTDGDESLVIVDKASPSTTVIADDATLRRMKRRSMSVSEVELKNAMTSASSSTPLPSTAEKPRKRESLPDTSLNGIMSDFHGQLSGFESPPTSNFDLHDPSTPARRVAMRSRTEEPAVSTIAEKRGKTFSDSPISTPPTFVVQPPTSPPPIVPPRSSSLIAPRSPTSPAQSPVSAWKHGAQYSPRRAPNAGGSSSAGRLRVHHSSASSSEPSLIPLHEDLRTRDRRSSVRISSTRPPSEDACSSREGNSVARSDSPFGDDDLEPSVKGKTLGARCWDEDEDFLVRDKIAEWLGSHGPVHKAALHHYMLNFDFSGQRLDVAFRQLCSKLYLKAETQQVDRILEEFSNRYWDCNPNSLYGSAGVVHQVTYSLLLLNTDLHVADLATRMSRSQFVRNTISTLQMHVPRSPGVQSNAVDFPQDDDGFQSAPVQDGSQTITRKTRSDSITSWNSVSRDLPSSSQVSVGASARPSNASSTSIPTFSPDPKSSSTIYTRGWESDMEQLLKEMYNSVKSQQILLPMPGTSMARTSTSSLRPGPGHNTLRNRSGRGPPDRLMNLRRGSVRGLQSIMAQSGVSPYSSNSSIDGRVSPSPSFATSLMEGNSSTSFLTPTLGFAFNLSSTIIRETQEDDDRSGRSDQSDSSMISITDEELALLGAPWAKEGMLCRKQYWESTGRRARDKSWLDVFVVISKGELNMFIFGDHSRGGAGAVGGGNWLENADSVGSVLLAHSLAHALPPPGYNRQRPHCMVLTLSNGGVYFFQAGTEELVNEWVSTCNYWAARTSKEPLAGGVSNMEYGWNRVDDMSMSLSSAGRGSGNAAMEDAAHDAMSVRSGRSTRSRFGGFSSLRSGDSPWSDKVHVNEWKPPQPPSVASVLDEEGQMEALQKHVASMKGDLKGHNELREAMLDLYQPKSSNANKALTNWEKKSQYLLTEIVKYESYVESLQHAMKLRFKRRGEKALERALNNGEERPKPSSSSKWNADTILEAEEPLTPGINVSEFAPSGSAAGTPTPGGR